MADESRPEVSLRSRLADGMFGQVDAASTAVFRILFGAVALYAACANPRLVPLGVVALGVLLGAWYRVASILLWLALAYLVLVERASELAQFHVALPFALLLAVVPAHRAWSFDSWRRRSRPSQTVSWWSVWAFRAEVVLVIVFIAVAKLDADWPYGASFIHQPISSGGMLSWLVLIAGASLWLTPSWPRVIVGRGRAGRSERVRPEVQPGAGRLVRLLVPVFVAGFFALQLLLAVWHWLTSHASAR